MSWLAFACVLVADSCAVRALRAARRLPGPAAIVHRNAWYLSMPPLVLANALAVALAFDVPAVAGLAIFFGMWLALPALVFYGIGLAAGARGWALRAMRVSSLAALCLALWACQDLLNPS